MKKQITLFFFLLIAVSGWSQITKADAAAFLLRNPVANFDKVKVYNTIGIDGSDHAYGTQVEYPKADVVSLSALESGYSLIVKQSGINREKYFPYGAIRYLMISSDNMFVIALRE
jgi:hypothetical protein